MCVFSIIFKAHYFQFFVLLAKDIVICKDVVYRIFYILPVYVVIKNTVEINVIEVLQQYLHLELVMKNDDDLRRSTLYRLIVVVLAFYIFVQSKQ